MEREIVYWDANAFLGYLNDEEGRSDNCGNLLKAAENGLVVIVTSALTLAEVVWIRGGSKLKPEKRALIEALFRAEYISVRNVTRTTAELARQLVWTKDIRHQDALHIATACMYRLPVLHTYDRKMIESSGVVIDGHQLAICEPSIVHQTDWVDEAAESAAGISGDLAISPDPG